MKMKKVFVLLAAITLIACSSNSSRTVSSSSIEDISSSSIEETSDASSESSENEDTSSGETTSTSSEASSSSSSQNESSSSSNSSSNSSSSQDTTGNKKTVSFLNGGFTGSLDEAKSQTSFVTWFNGDDNILSSIVCTNKAQVNYIGNTSDSWRFSTLILGSQNALGTITFNFNVHITSVKIVVQPYTKYITYSNTYNIDKSATFVFNQEETDLSVAADYSGETEKTTIECTPNANENKFTISNKEIGQRVFVHSFELSY